MRTYKLIRGRYVEGKGENRKTYMKGDRIKSEKDLLKFNPPGMPPKFELLFTDNSTPVQSAEPENVTRGEEQSLESMTVAQLRELAEAEEIDLNGATLKADIIEKIQEAMNDE